MSAASDTPAREELSFRSAGERCAAWLYRPAPVEGDPPCVVMAHGFSLTRHDGLDLYASRFAAAGLAALVFDYRFLGDSGGEPRQRFRAREQLVDWRNAITFARTLPGIDQGRTVLWGYSYSGGHVVTLAAREAGIAAALVMCPHVNGWRRAIATKPAVTAWITPRALLDLAGHHLTIPVTGPDGSRAAMSFVGEGEGFEAAVSADSPWRNEISPGAFATTVVYRPLRFASRIRSPLWVGRGTRDISVDGRSIQRLAERAERADFHDFDLEHFDPVTEAHAAGIAASQIDFLRRQSIAPLPGAAAAAAGEAAAA